MMLFKNKRESKPHLVAVTRVHENNLTRSYERRGILKARRSVKTHTLEEGMVIALPYFRTAILYTGQPAADTNILCRACKALKLHLAPPLSQGAEGTRPGKEPVIFRVFSVFPG